MKMRKLFVVLGLAVSLTACGQKSDTTVKDTVSEESSSSKISVAREHDLGKTEKMREESSTVETTEVEETEEIESTVIEVGGIEYTVIDGIVQRNPLPDDTDDFAKAVDAAMNDQEYSDWIWECYASENVLDENGKPYSGDEYYKEYLNDTTLYTLDQIDQIPADVLSQVCYKSIDENGKTIVNFGMYGDVPLQLPDITFLYKTVPDGEVLVDVFGATDYGAGQDKLVYALNGFKHFGNDRSWGIQNWMDSWEYDYDKLYNEPWIQTNRDKLNVNYIYDTMNKTGNLYFEKLTNYTETGEVPFTFMVVKKYNKPTELVGYEITGLTPKAGTSERSLLENGGCILTWKDLGISIRYRAEGDMIPSFYYYSGVFNNKELEAAKNAFGFDPSVSSWKFDVNKGVTQIKSDDSNVTYNGVAFPYVNYTSHTDMFNEFYRVRSMQTPSQRNKGYDYVTMAMEQDGTYSIVPNVEAHLLSNFPYAKIYRVDGETAKTLIGLCNSNKMVQHSGVTTIGGVVEETYKRDSMPQ